MGAAAPLLDLIMMSNGLCLWLAALVEDLSWLTDNSKTKKNNNNDDDADGHTRYIPGYALTRKY